MQAMPMINQPAEIYEAVAPRATRSGNAKSDDRFSPVLEQACSEDNGDDLAGAAMVVQDQEGKQETVVEPRTTQGASTAQNDAKGFVATAEVIANTSMIAEPVGNETVITANGDISALAATNAGGGVAAGVENLTAKSVGAESAVSPEEVPSDLNIDDADSLLTARRNQSNTSRSNPTSAAVVAPAAIIAPATSPVVEAQVSTSAQVVATVSELQPLQQLNIPPLTKTVVKDVGAEKSNTKGTSGGSGVVVTDPRFASLLNKPEVGESLRQQQNLETPLVASVSTSVATISNESLSLQQNSSDSENGAVLTPTANSLGGTEPFGVSLAANPNAEATISSAIQPQMAPSVAATSSPTEVSIPLRDGSSMPEARVVQQTIDHLTLHSRGDSSSVTVKLHPEELGELQLRMVMEGDQLKVHLHAQSQQVQEVLERNFPRLRDALQEQGVTVEDFQVSSDSGDRSDQQFSDQQEFVANMQADHFSSRDRDEGVDNITAAPAALSQSDGRSVSLRV